MVQGLDISYWQTNAGSVKGVDFNKAVSAGARFAFIRASCGLKTDVRFIENWERAKLSGIMRGAYHYAMLGENYKSQILSLVASLKNDSGELPVALDLEKTNNENNMTRAKLLAFAQNFKTDMKEYLNKDIVLYSNPDIISNYLKPVPQWLLDTDLWIANYGVTTPSIGEWKSWKFWQYSNRGDGRSYGMESISVDLNYFNGSYDNLLSYVLHIPVLSIEDRVSNLENWAITMGYKK